MRRSLEKEISEAEQLIHTLEARKQELEQLLSNPELYNNVEKLRSYSEEYSGLDSLLEEALFKWEEASENLLELDE